MYTNSVLTIAWMPVTDPKTVHEMNLSAGASYGYMLKDYLWDIGTHEAYKACGEFFTSTQNKIME
jgi:hypothetical protein